MELEVKGRHSHPYNSSFSFSCLCYFPLSPCPRWVVMEIKAGGGGASIIEAVVGLVVGWELAIVK